MEEDELSSFLGGLGTRPGSSSAPVDVPQAASTADLDRFCASKGGLCALALLDASDAGFQGQLDTFREAAGKWAKQPLHFCWVDAARQVSARDRLLRHLAAMARALLPRTLHIGILLLRLAHVHAQALWLPCGLQ